jgi:hypothetical protein
VADTLFGFLTHPVAVAAHIFGQATGTVPGIGIFTETVTGNLLGLGGAFDGRADRSEAREARRNLNHGLVDENGHGVEVGGKRGQAEALGLEGDGTSAREGVVEGGHLLGVEAGQALVHFAGFAPALLDFVAGLGKYGFVGSIFPQHQLADDVEEAFALLGSIFL